MKLLITCKKSDPRGYSYFYDIEKRSFIENYLETPIEKPRKYIPSNLPMDLANHILLDAFILALLSMDYDSALHILMVSKASHRHISTHFQVRNFKLFSIVKLAATMIDVALSEHGEVCWGVRGIDFSTDVMFPQPRDLFDDCVVQTYFTETNNAMKARCYQTGPTMLDSALVIGHFAAGLCASTFFAMPFILFRVLDESEENVLSQHSISNEWSALSKTLRYCLGIHFKLLVVVTTLGDDRIIHIPTTADKANNPVSLAFT